MPHTVTFMVVRDVILFFTVVAGCKFASVSFLAGDFFGAVGGYWLIGGCFTGNDTRWRVFWYLIRCF